MKKEDVLKLHITQVAVNDKLINGEMSLDEARAYSTEVAIASDDEIWSGSDDEGEVVEEVVVDKVLEDDDEKGIEVE